MVLADAETKKKRAAKGITENDFGSLQTCGGCLGATPSLETIPTIPAPSEAK
jgi:hypothetical protein